MKTLYFDCAMGAAGDMLTAALLELVDDKEAFLNKLNSVGFDSVEYKAELSTKCGINGTHMSVLVSGEEEDEHMHDHHHHDHDHEHEHEHHHHDHDHEHEHHHDHDHEHEHEHHHHDHDHDHEHGHHHHHHHSSLHDIEHIVRGHLNISDKVKDDVMSVYNLIAEAESVAHGVKVEEIHFHEVGTMDAIADVVAVCMLMEEINPDKVRASSVHVGSGTVRCAHGILPVPAPATAYILKDVPIYGGKIKSELCTPTGAALLKHFVSEFGDLEEMSIKKIGYGMGRKDFEVANCVRALLGESKAQKNVVIELSCNIDDMTGERLAYGCEALMNEGALDVHTIDCGMKKGRKGVVLHVICKPEDKDKMVQLIFKYTSTIGIRENVMNRYVLDRKTETVETEFGHITKKVCSGYGVSKEKFEYEDLARIARENDCSIDEILNKIK